jgi:hypothetical protein
MDDLPKVLPDVLINPRFISLPNQHQIFSTDKNWNASQPASKCTHQSTKMTTTDSNKKAVIHHLDIMLNASRGTAIAGAVHHVYKKKISVSKSKAHYSRSGSLIT